MEDSFGLNVGAASTEEEYMGLWNPDGGIGGGGLLGGGGFSSGSMLRNSGTLAIERVARTRDLRPEVVVVAHEKTAREELGVHPGESWSWSRHAEVEVLKHVDKFKTLGRVIAAVAKGLDEGRTKGLPQMQAYFHQFYRVLEDTAKDPNHDMAWSYPLLGVKDPFAPRAKTKWSAMEQSALALYHKEEHALDQVRKMYGSHAATAGTGASASGGSGSSGSQTIDQQIKAAVNAELKKRGKDGQKGRGKGDEGRGRGKGARADAAES